MLSILRDSREAPAAHAAITTREPSAWPHRSQESARTPVRVCSHLADCSVGHLWLRVSPRLQPEYWPGVQPLEGSRGGGLLPSSGRRLSAGLRGTTAKLIYTVVGRILFLEGCWTEDLRFL